MSLASIIVPCYLAEATLDRCLHSLLRQRTPGALEVVVVLNNSSDSSPQIARRCAQQSKGRLRVVTEARQGAANARNRGLEAARGDAVLFVDADCYAHEDWAQQLLEQLQDPDVAIVGGGIVGDPQQQTLVARYARRRGLLGQRMALSHALGPFLQTANLGVRRRDAFEIGGFDPQLHSGEDADFCWRLMRRRDPGGLRYVPQAQVFHQHRETVGALLGQCRVHGWSHVALGRRHGVHWPTAVKRAGADALGAVALPLRMLAGGWRALVERDPLPVAAPVLTTLCAAGQRAGQMEALLGLRPRYTQIRKAAAPDRAVL